MLKGEVISGRFEVEHLSGAGGMGQVYRARDLRTGEPVALKVLYQVGPLEIERFAREADVLSNLRHPGIVRYIEGGAAPGGGPYLAMEWLDGEPLSERLKRVQLTLSESLTLGVRVASALSAVHQHFVVHRDLKPSNIFLRGGAIDDITLIDFGIAWRPDGGRHLTIPGAMLGTPGYIAPEQAHGAPDIDSRADVFSLGCVLFRCLAGRGAFQGNDALSVLLKVAADEPPRLRELRPAIPTELDALVARMLSKSRDDRPRDGGEVAEALLAMADVIADADPLSSGVVSVRRGGSLELTGVERRVMSLVLARGPDRAGDATLPAAREGDESRTPGAESGGDRGVRAVAERHRGKLEILADGSLLVLLSSADAATDLVARAARCALALRSQLDGLPVVIVSGREILGPRLPTGELIDRAVHLLALSSPADEVIAIDDVTAGLLGAGFGVEADGEGFCLRGERSALDGQRPLLGKPTACVGRERELLQLEALFDQCVEERMASAVLVTAAAGVGKSRLVHELLRKLEGRAAAGPGPLEAPEVSVLAPAGEARPIEIWYCQGDSMSAGSAFGLLARALRRAFGIVDGEPLASRRQKLRARVDRRVPPADAPRVAELLGELVGTSFVEASGSLPRDPVLLGEQMRWAFLTFLRAECAAAPLLLVVEDLQWGDLPTVRFLDAALDDLRERPLMVLAVGRPEVQVIFPRLWAGRGAQEIRLRQLSRRASERLVRQVLGSEVGPDTLDALVSRADGHAFYLEELIRAVSAGKGKELPETVLAMVQARLERLDPEARRVLRAASVFGETFWRGGVEALLGTTGPGPWLTELCAQEVIAAKEHDRFPEQIEYRFRHSLVRQAAYGMLADADRVLGHRLAGQWLEQAGETDAMVLAEHFERGDASDRAVSWFFRATEQALEGGDLDAVLARSARGLACGATGATRGSLVGMAGYVYTWRTRYAEAAASYREALLELPRGGAAWHLAIGGGLHASASTGDFARMGEMIEELRAGLGEELAPIPPLQGMTAAVPTLCIAGQHALARDFIDRLSNGAVGAEIARCHYAFFAAGDPWALRAHATAAVAHGERTGEARVIHMARTYEGIALAKLGDAKRGEQALREARASAASRGLRLVGHFADLFLADLLTNRRALDEASTLLEESREHAAESAVWGAVWSICSARVARRRGALDAARGFLLAAMAVCDGLSPGYHAHALAILANVERESGADPAVPVAHFHEALRVLDTIGTCYNDVGIRVYSAEGLDLIGDRAGALVALAAARAQVAARAAAIDDDGYRESYLERVPENVRAVALARRWGLEERPGGG